MSPNELIEKDLRAISYIDGIFDILTLLNEYNDGREFYVSEIEMKEDGLESAILNFLGPEYSIQLSPIENFQSQIKEIYDGFCQNYIWKLIPKSRQQAKSNNYVEFARLLNNKYIKELFVRAITSFAEDASKIEEVKVEGDYLMGLPHKIYVIYKDHETMLFRTRGFHKCKRIFNASLFTWRS